MSLLILKLFFSTSNQQATSFLPETETLERPPPPILTPGSIMKKFLKMIFFSSPPFALIYPKDEK
jgi:hypothetical protein